MAQGSWTLLTETGQVLEGTWSAQMTSLGGHGSWTARTLEGRSFSGTWKAYITDSGGKAFEKMLEWTAEKEIAGSWQSSRFKGNWWLKGSPKGRRR